MHLLRAISFAIILCCAQETYADRITPCFTPQHNCTSTIVRILDQAVSEILVQAYSFTSKDIADALLRAHKRGVHVRLLLDKSQRSDKHSRSTTLTSEGMDVKVDEVPGIAHNKVMIIDEVVVITGSFNFTHAAQHRNTENVVVIESTEIAGQYKQNWLNRASSAKPYATKLVPPKAKVRTQTTSYVPNIQTSPKQKPQKPHVKVMRQLLKHLKDSD